MYSMPHCSSIPPSMLLKASHGVPAAAICLSALSLSWACTDNEQNSYHPGEQQSVSVNASHVCCCMYAFSLHAFVSQQSRWHSACVALDVDS